MSERVKCEAEAFSPGLLNTESDSHALATSILCSDNPFTLGLAAELPLQDVKVALAENGSDQAWQAYDLVHSLEVFGRAW